MLRVLVPLVAALQLEAAARSPVEKVVELIEELKAKIEADGASEQKIYDKYACWCETTTQRKADNIDEGKAVIGRTTTFILVKKGAIATLATEIAELEAKIAKNNEAMKKLTAIREKENSDYQQEKAEMETALSSLHSAIEVLNGAGTGGDDGTREGSRDALLARLSAVSKVRSAVLAAPKVAELPAEQSALLKSFLEDPLSFMQSQPADYYDKKAQAKASYSPASATVMGILKDMYETFASNLEKANTDESALQKGYEDLMAEKTAQNKLDRKTATDKEAEKAEKSQQLADAEQKLEDTKAQLAEDEEFFETARQQCKDKSDSWDERKRLRTEELDGINKALEILTSDESRAAFASAEDSRPQDTFGEVATRDEPTPTAFLQIDEEGAPRERAYKALKHAVGQTKSLRLARLAATVRAASKGHFDEVIASIDSMIATLAAEEKEDVKQRDWCIDEQNKETNHKEDLEYEIKQLEAKIERAELKKAKLQEDKATTLQNKADLEAAMAEALQDRTDQNGAFTTAKADDIKAIGLLEDAIAAMSEYGSNNLALLQKQPEFEVSEDQAPDATFSDSGSHKDATTGIVSLLTNIKEELEKEVALGTSSEASAQRAYQELRANADRQIEEYDAQVVSLDASIAKTNDEILADNGTKTDKEGEHTTTVEYLEDIAPNCNWIKGAFEKRAAARKAESEGLTQAKSILAGAAGGDFGFLQAVA